MGKLFGDFGDYISNTRRVPENGWLENETSFWGKRRQKAYFQGGEHVSFRECTQLGVATWIFVNSVKLLGGFNQPIGKKMRAVKWDHFDRVRGEQYLSCHHLFDQISPQTKKQSLGFATRIEKSDPKIFS